MTLSLFMCKTGIIAMLALLGLTYTECYQPNCQSIVHEAVHETALWTINCVPPNSCVAAPTLNTSECSCICRQGRSSGNTEKI